MPRAKKEEGSSEPKKRSRTGCWPCKARKVKCGEERPACNNCLKSGEACDYSIRLNWGGRAKREREGLQADSNGFTFVATPSSVSSAASAHEHVFSSQHIATTRPSSGRGTPTQSFATPASRIQEATRPIPRSDGSMPVDWSPQGTSKRLRMSPQGVSAQPSPTFLQPDHTSPSSTYYTPPSIDSVVNTPGSSITSTSPYPAAAVAHVPIQDIRKMSVKSLLVDPPDEPQRPRYPRYDSHGFYTHGYDHGNPDLDTPHNNDAAAIQGSRSPDMRRASMAVSEISTASYEPDSRDIAFEPGGYYGKPVAIRIARVLEPLPQELKENNMNLLYFHHFLNHTARIMVPHDCPENPLRGVLPQMAIRNKQLLHLMLAFSASHRARLLGHPEPATRIAEWMDDVLPALRIALNESNPTPIDPNDLGSLAPLATAIMMASLEILSPNTFAVPISWQNHLNVARNLIKFKGGLHRVTPQAGGMPDKAVFLISRWFAYLDVLGSLSGGQYRRPLDGAYLENGGGNWLVNRTDDELFQIDCFFGFSGRCIALLAAVAELAAVCDRQRLDPITQQQRPGWQPPADIREHAIELRSSLLESAQFVSGGCMHSEIESPGGRETKTEQERDEIRAVNEAFHWAGMLHVSKRVLGLSREDTEVQEGVRKVLESLARVRRGSTAENCLLFPMFTAGCECIDVAQRQNLVARMKAIEGWGMQHVARGREVMERVWQTGAPWEVLVNENFLG